MKTNKVIIVGNNETAELGLWYLKNDSNYEVIGFATDSTYIKEDTFHNLPVFPYEDIEKSHSPTLYNLFAPMQGKKMNTIRKDIFDRGKSKGYNFISYISSRAHVLTDKIGENCFILENNVIQPYVEVGNGLVMWSTSHIGHHSVIKDHIFITGHVVIPGRCIIEDRCYFAMGSCIKDQITIGEGCFIGTGAVIDKSTDPDGVYMGVVSERHKVPARRIF
jgi:sugar O-acyltransferase (sialic acid O-acetyltransferase NeuD family)